MAEKSLNKGDIVYREGDVPDFAYAVQSGRIEMVDTSKGRESQVRIVEAGKTFGEYALFDPQTLRPFTARALEPSVLSSVSIEEFNALLPKCPKEILPFLMLSFEKMKVTKVKEKAFIGGALETDITKIIIEPASDVMKALVKPVEVPMGRLPFRIGGYPEGGETNRRDGLHLAICCPTNPLRISRQHCEITVDDKALMLLDLGSRFNTSVNGVVIGRGRGHYAAPLVKGENKIILGAADGPYKLTMKCG